MIYKMMNKTNSILIISFCTGVMLLNILQIKESINIVPLPGSDNNNNNNNNNISPKYVYPDVLYGHVHMAKTGGTNLNGVFANKFERVCGHKGYSYDAYNTNERSKIKLLSQGEFNRDKIPSKIIHEIGFENCDYISHEVQWPYWIEKFGDKKFHNISMELHIPCRERIDHMMSQCNMLQRKINCDTISDDDDEFYQSISNCVSYFMDRYNHTLKNHFDRIKCYDYKKQFTTYIDYMNGILQSRRLVSTPYVQRVTNAARNKSKECIWERPDLIEKANKWLVTNIEYYQFCDECIGSDNDMTKAKVIPS